MKILLDGLLVAGLAVPHGAPVELSIYIGEAAMTTRRQIYDGTVASFPDIYEFELDDVSFVSDLLELEFEVMNWSNPDQSVIAGHAKSTLKSLVPLVNESLEVTVPLKKKAGEIRLRVLLSMGATSLDDLKQKCDEVEQLRAICSDYEAQLKELEKLNQDNIAVAEKNIEKLTKKYQSATDKYNDLQERYMSASVQNEKLQAQLIEARESSHSSAKEAGATLSSYKQANDELTAKLAALRQENETLFQAQTAAVLAHNKLSDEMTAKVGALSQENENNKLALRKETEDNHVLRLELDEVYSSKYEESLHLNDKITTLTEENTRLSTEARQHVELIAELSQRVKQLGDDMGLQVATKHISMSATFVSQAMLTSTAVNNTYIETLLSSSSTTNNYVTNIIQSTDIEAIRREFLAQLRRCDNLTKRNLSLMERLQAAVHPLTVCVRTRPPNEEESSLGNLVVENVAQGSGDVNFYVHETKEWVTARVDAHWGYDYAQSDVFTDLEPMVSGLVPSLDALAEGRGIVNEDACVLVWGGKGSGKTFTAFGFGAHVGIAYRALQRLFELLDFQKTQLELLAKEPAGLENKGLQQGQLAYQLFISLFAVTGDQVVDALAVQPTPLPGISYNVGEQAVSLPASCRVHVQTLPEAITKLAKALSVLHAKDLSKTSLVLEMVVEAQFDPAFPPVRKSLRVADLTASDNTAADPNLQALEKVLGALGKEERLVEYGTSALVTLLRPALRPAARTTVVMTIAPSDRTLPVTRKVVDFAVRLRSVCKPQAAGSGYGATSVELRAVQMRMRTVSSELREAKARSVMVEETLVQTKHTAADLVNQFNERNKLIVAHYQEEKSISKQLQLDLDLTYRHLKRVLEELKEQKRANERLVQILKVMEDERQAAMQAKTVGSLGSLSSPTKA